MTEMIACTPAVLEEFTRRRRHCENMRELLTADGHLEQADVYAVEGRQLGEALDLLATLGAQISERRENLHDAGLPWDIFDQALAGEVLNYLHAAGLVEFGDAFGPMRYDPDQNRDKDRA